MSHYILTTDAASRSNPGKAAAAFMLQNCIVNDDQSTQFEILYINGLYLGDNISNNVAEYSAILYGLLSALSLNIHSLSVISDSELVINQLNNRYQVKSDKLLPYHTQIKYLEQYRFHNITYTHAIRSTPDIAKMDALCNKILDNL